MAIDMQKNILEESQQAWSHLQMEYERGFIAEILYTLTASNTKDSLTIKVMFDKNNDLNHTKFVDDSAGERVFAVNPDYSFQIKKDPANWNIVDLSPVSIVPDKDLSAKRTLLQNTEFLFAGIMLERCMAADLIKSKDFQIVSLKKERVKDNEEDYIELVFRSNFISFDKNRILGGKIIFDPNRFWVIRNYEIETDFLPSNPKDKNDNYETFTINVSIDYQDVDGCPFPKTYKYSCTPGIQNKVFDYQGELTVSINSISRVPVPSEEFRISRYGFSEPGNPARRGNVIRLVFAVCGILLIICGLYFRYIAAKS
ncbi:hypothetical protein FACS1894214_0600 [Planctomycetales bacterium]|nr:hypothetical protein FACS1894214_0600 [Planctomycetales bacterium]